MAARGKIRIGISGWTYKGWRGIFYPEDLAHKRELAYAAQAFPSVEINGTFYSLQRPQTFARWRDETPEDFVFAIKGSRYITHMRQLREVETPLANFLASGLLRLGPKLGPILWQFPARMKFDPDRFARFLDLLPRTTEQAAKLARKHDARLNGRASMKNETDLPLRHAFEIRSESFCTQEFVDLLKAHNAALVVADTVEWPLVMDMTADFVYCRLHGSQDLYTSGYDDKALDIWAKRVDAWARGKEPGDAHRIGGPAPKAPKGRDIFVYFDNDVKVRAPFDAQGLIKRLETD
jgi:uncharacterized protein YecE (DUF72 family)